MPRKKTKDQEELDIKKTVEKKDSTKKKSPTKKKSSSTTKKTTTKKASSSTTKKTATKKSATSTAKKTATKKAASSAAKKTATKKTASSVAKKTTTKKAATKKATTKKKSTSTAKKTTTRKKTVKKPDIVEYYDLPYRYNQTVVKILAQTPTTLFVYWDISDEDRKNFEKEFGDNFFYITRPVLIVHNDTLNYSFEIEINDFANSWYLHVADSKCDYRIELGRRPIQNIVNPEKPEEIKKSYNEYIYITTSNEIESPNDKILFNEIQKMVYFRNVKTGVQTSKDISTLSFIRNMGKIYNIYDIYKAIYQDENMEDVFDLSNPSSGNPTSTSLSSKFK